MERKAEQYIVRDWRQIKGQIQSKRQDMITHSKVSALYKKVMQIEKVRPDEKERNGSE